MQDEGEAQGFDLGRNYLWQEQLYGPEGRPGEGDKRHYGPQWALLRLDHSFTAPAVMRLSSSIESEGFFQHLRVLSIFKNGVYKSIENFVGKRYETQNLFFIWLFIPLPDVSAEQIYLQRMKTEELWPKVADWHFHM